MPPTSRPRPRDSIQDHGGGWKYCQNTGDGDDENTYSDGSRGRPVVIAVMGLTGAGKSSFIQSVTECKSPLEVGDAMRLRQCSIPFAKERVTEARNFIGIDFGMTYTGIGYFGKDVKVGHHPVQLIDTPGFDDTYISEREVLEGIAAWIGNSYSHNIKLNDIIYVDRINDKRPDGTAIRNPKMFQTMWHENDSSGTMIEGGTNVSADNFMFIKRSPSEAAAVYMSKTRDPSCLNVRDEFLVCDAGGGTVDLISHEVTANSLRPPQLNPSIRRHVHESECLHDIGDGWDANYIDTDSDQGEEGVAPYQLEDPNSKRLQIGIPWHGFKSFLDIFQALTKHERCICRFHGVLPDEYLPDAKGPSLPSMAPSSMIVEFGSGERCLESSTFFEHLVMPATACKACWWKCHRVLRRMVKFCILILSPGAILVLERYAYGRGLVKSSTFLNSWKLKPDSTSQIGAWIFHPPALAFFASSVLLGWLFAWHYEMNEAHRYQHYFLVLGLLAWPTLTFALDIGFIASILCILPWAVYASLVVSEVVHLVIARSRKIGRLPCDSGSKSIRSEGQESYSSEPDSTPGTIRLESGCPYRHRSHSDPLDGQQLDSEDLYCEKVEGERRE